MKHDLREILEQMKEIKPYEWVRAAVVFAVMVFVIGAIGG